MYERYIYECLTDAEKAGLEDKYKEYRYLSQEYHDGMLIFDLMKKEVWDKASQDSAGLRAFYEDNKLNYTNRKEIDISVFKYADVSAYTNASKLLTKNRKKYTDDELVRKLSSKDPNAIQKIESGFYSFGESIYADKIYRMVKKEELSEDQKIVNLPNEQVLIYINGSRIVKDKSFDEIKGILIADYQEYLEKAWLKKLKKKYKIEVNESELKKIKKSL
jgi:peptidyl-prolyl cis-trans isomerase SurA